MFQRKVYVFTHSYTNLSPERKYIYEHISSTKMIYEYITGPKITYGGSDLLVVKASRAQIAADKGYQAPRLMRLVIRTGRS